MKKILRSTGKNIVKEQLYKMLDDKRPPIQRPYLGQKEVQVLNFLRS